MSSATTSDVPLATVDVLRDARDRAGRSPRQWLANSLPRSAGPVFEVACEAEHAGRRVTVRPVRSDGSRPSAGRPEVGGHAVGAPGALPLARDAAGGVRTCMCLPVVESLDALFGELRRVLRPAGTLAALVPSRPGLTPAELRTWRPANRALGGRPGFRNATARDHLGWHLAAADFALLTDQRRIFWLPLPDVASASSAVAGLVAAGVWPPDVSPDQLDRARDTLAAVASPGRRLPIPLRLLVGRR